MSLPRHLLCINASYSAADMSVVAAIVGKAAARRLLRHAGSLWSLRRFSEARLRCAGLSLGASRRLLAAFELGARAMVAPAEMAPLRGPRDGYALVAPHFAGCMRERFVVVALDTKSRPLYVAVVAEGTCDSCPVDPRDVFRSAICESASSVLVAHNHPSGNLQVSSDDVALTARLFEAGALLGIRLLDHIVVAYSRHDATSADYVSLSALGMLPALTDQSRSVSSHR